MTRMTDSRLGEAFAHWQAVYLSKDPGQVSWYRPHLNTSLELLKSGGLHAGSRILDVGAGASTLVDDLLALGVVNITALDISDAALEITRRRLGSLASKVHWVAADIAKAALEPAGVDLWHDRAALHFLDAKAADAYADRAAQAMAPGGHAVIGCFAADGPERCSGLPVARRDPVDIARLFGTRFALVESRFERHSTPWGSPQAFAYALLKRVPS